jgi:hypothetical protein
MDTPKPKYSEEQLHNLLENIYNGDVTIDDLPKDLYIALGEYFQKAIIKGFGSNDFVNDVLLNDLRDNVWLFSAAKTYAFTNAASDLLLKEDGVIKSFSQFYKDGQELAGVYLENWAQAEYVTIIGQSQMAEQWRGIEKNKDITPYLTFSTAGNPCPECAPFDGLTRLVDDPIWNKATPLLHFRCACILIPSDDAKLSSDSFVDDLPIDTIPEDFRNNPGKTGEIFTSANPYFQDVPKELSKTNFGFKIPKL